MILPKRSHDVRFRIFQPNDVRFQLFESRGVRFQLCSTLPDIVRLCSTLLEYNGHCLTLFDFIGSFSFLLGINQTVLIYDESRTSFDRSCQVTCQKPQPGQQQNVIENATNLNIVDSYSSGWGVRFMFWSTRRKMAMLPSARLKMAMLRPTRPKLAVLTDWLKAKWLRLCSTVVFVRPY